MTSLREAIFATSLIGGADAIEFAAALTSAGAATITLTEGELAITDSLTINGPGADLLIIDASGNDPTPDVNNGDGSRVFNIDDGVSTNLLNVSISGLTLTGGDVGGVGGPNGGAIRSLENLTVMTSTISGNSVANNGGGIWHQSGILTVTGSAISDNSAGFNGGGISSLLATVTATGSTISGNSAGQRGGGLHQALGSLTVTGSTISGNTAGNDAGGIRGTATLSHTIVTGNTRGGGEANDATGSVALAFSLLGVDTWPIMAGRRLRMRCRPAVRRSTQATLRSWLGWAA